MPIEEEFKFDALKKLGPLSWRGIKVPIVSRKVDFSQSLARQKFGYRDNAFIESLGAENFSSYTIPFRQGIVRGPYDPNLFSVTLPAFIVACRDSTAGELHDPVLGNFRCKCTSFSSSLDMNKRDGVDVDVAFVYAPEIDEVEKLPSKVASTSAIFAQLSNLDGDIDKGDWGQQVGAASSAELVETAEVVVESITGELVRTGVFGPPEPFADLFGQIDGFGRQIERFGNKIDAKLNNVLFKLEKMEETISVLEEPANWPILKSSRRIRANIESTKERLANPGRAIFTMLTKSYQSIGNLASAVGMPVDRFLRLNPSLSKHPLVPPNTAVNYISDKLDEIEGKP